MAGSSAPGMRRATTCPLFGFTLRIEGPISSPIHMLPWRSTSIASLSTPVSEGGIAASVSDSATSVVAPVRARPVAGVCPNFNGIVRDTTGP